MLDEYLVFENQTTFVFHRDSETRSIGFAGSLLFGLFAIYPYIDYLNHPLMSKGSIWFGYMIPSFVLGPLWWMCLRIASPMSLRFDVQQGSYTIRDGCFPLRRTEQGPMTDIEKVYVFGYFAKSAGRKKFPILLQWRRRGLWRRSPTRLGLTDHQWDSEQIAWEYARKFGVPCGDTVIQGQ